MTKYILFVCSENSARSQMAEGFFNYYNKNPEYFANSAGINPARSTHPYAIKVMMEKGIDISKQQRPKKITSYMAQDAFMVYTMGCARDCPYTPPDRTEEWDLESLTEEPIEKYRETRDIIEQKVKKLISELE